MSSTFGVFEAAKSGLSVSMQQLNVTEQNLTNVNTKGYTRQRILTSAKEPPSGTYLVAPLNKAAIGQGVEVTGIQQIRSSYLDQQYRNMNSSYSNSTSRTDSLGYLTGLFKEFDDDSSLTTSIKNFYAAMNTFSSDTSSKAYRTDFQKSAESMTETFSYIYNEMKSLWNDQNDSISTVTQNINSIAKKIAGLNESIAKAEQTGGTANDLNDERNLLLDELSSYVNITYSPNSENPSMTDVQIGGVTLVDGMKPNSIQTGSISGITQQIAQLNTIITGASYSAAQKADAKTQIDGLVAQLQKTSSKVNIAQNGTTGEVTTLGYDKDGDATYESNLLTTSVDTIAGGDVNVWADLSRNRLTMVDSTTSPSTLTNLDIGTGGAITDGQLYSNMQMVTGKSSDSPGIPYYMDQMNVLVRTIAKNINDIHLQGYTYPDGSNSSHTGVLFFHTDTPPTQTALDSNSDGTPDVDQDGNTIYTYNDTVGGNDIYATLTAGNFRLSDDVAKDPYNIAGSSRKIVLNTASPKAGNNEIASKMYDDMELNNYYDKLDSIVGNLAITAKTSASLTSTKGSLVDSIDTQRLSLSAVSQDEETTNLIIFQQSYNACAKIISTLDDMLNTLINSMGVR